VASLISWFKFPNKRFLRSDGKCFKNAACSGLGLMGDSWMGLSSGFYMLEVRVIQGGHITGSLEFFNGSQSRAKICIPLPPNRISKRVVHVRSDIDRVVLVTPDENQNVLLDVKAVPLTGWRAKILMIKKIKACGDTFALSSLNVDELYQRYDQFFTDHAGEGGYPLWIKASEPKLWLSDVIKTDLRFSIVTPVYNAKPQWLERLVHSVIAQSYPDWELILVDDCSDSEETAWALDAMEFVDPRIKVVRRLENGNISAATNSGIQEASGDFITFLDHDDSLAPQALNEVAAVLINRPDLKLVYSDEDLVAENEVRVAPHFKSDWNPDLFFSHNYITHLAVYRRDLMESLGGCRIGYEGAQDFDLALRATAQLSAEEIHHIPKILYNWYMVEGSTAASSDAKNYALEAGLKAVSERIAQLDPEAVVETTKRDHFFRTRWSLPEGGFTTSVIIPTRNGVDILNTCIDSLVSTADCGNLEIVIVDNGSSERSAHSYFKELKSADLRDALGQSVVVKVVRDDGDFNFSRLMNLGAASSSGQFLLLLNNDTEFTESGWLGELVSQANRQDIGCVGAKLLYPDSTIQHAGVILGLGGYAAHSHRGMAGDSAGYFCRADTVQNLSAVTAACLMVRREVFEKVGGFDVEFAVAYNDVDFCLRVMDAGYRNLYTPYARLIHHESKTRGDDVSPERAKRFDGEKARLLDRWYDLIQSDPYYNPNLTKSREDFSIKRPSEYQ
jgi:O-antigen biosynthesis protein